MRPVIDEHWRAFRDTLIGVEFAFLFWMAVFPSTRLSRACLVAFGWLVFFDLLDRAMGITWFQSPEDYILTVTATLAGIISYLYDVKIWRLDKWY